MSRGARWRWKRAVQTIILIYALGAWLVPFALLMWFGPLPYLTEATFLDRVLVWTVGTAGLAGVMGIGVITTGQPPLWSEMFGGSRVKVTLELAAMFAFCVLLSAWVSPTLGGALVKMTPGSTYRSMVSVEHVGSPSRSRRERYSTISVEVRSTEDDRLRYLNLSERFFADLAITAGDLAVLRGKQNLFGVYVDSIEVTRSRAGTSWLPPDP